MFSYREILNLDVRDQAFWVRAARRRILMDQMLRIQAIRIGMADQAGYDRGTGELRAQLMEIDEGENSIRETWMMLKARGRG